MALASLAVAMALCLAGLTAVTMQVRCVDAAREAARLAARGDQQNALVVGRRLAPAGAAVSVHHDGGFVVATVRAQSSLLPGITIGAEGVSAVESGEG